MSYDERNVYYHAFKTCVAAHFRDFNAPVHIKVSREMKEKLLSVHSEHFKQEFDLDL